MQIAVIGSGAIALFECVTVSVVALRRHVPAETVLIYLPPAFGKMSLSHLLVWVPVMLALAAVLRVAVSVRGKRKPVPAAVLVAAFVAISGCIVLPADLYLAGKTASWVTPLACIGSLLLAIAACVFVQRAGSHPVMVRALTWATVAAVCVGIAFFVRSPFFRPARACFDRGVRVAPTDAVTRPNVLWIVLDTVRAARMSNYGYERSTTPFLEKWADRSIRFERCMADGMWTLPSHASMLTGLSPREHGAGYSYAWLDDEFTSIAEILRDAGYETALLSNNPWISQVTNVDQGFNLCVPIIHLRHMSDFSLEHLVEKLGWIPPLPWFDTDLGASLTGREVARWLDRHGDNGSPVFLFINYYEAHAPYVVPRRYRRMFMRPEQVRRSYALRLRAHGDLPNALAIEYDFNRESSIDSGDIDVLRRQYDAAIRYLDDRVAEVIGMFAERDMLENTLVILTSDHGEHLGTHGMWGHNFFTYDDLIHVPLIVREPGRTKGSSCATPVQLSDIATSVIAATLGRPALTAETRSEDVLGLASAPPANRITFSQYSAVGAATEKIIRERGGPELLTVLVPQIATHDGRFKLMTSARGALELYDVIEDPGERRNLAGTHRAIAGRLGGELDQWLRSVPRREKPADQAPAFDDDTIRTLRGLGYLGGADP